MATPEQPPQGITISPELAAKIAATQAQQAEADKIGTLAASAAVPGPMREVWCIVPDIKEGPFTIRRFRDGDFIRLAQLGHPLENFTAIAKWLSDPKPSGPEAWLLNWLMTTPIEEVKKEMQAGVESVRAKAEAVFSELDGYQLAHVMRGIVKQLTIYMGARVDYEPVPTSEAAASPPPLSQP